MLKPAQIDYVSAVAVWLRDHEYFSKARADREGGVLPTSFTVFDQLDVLLPRVLPDDRARAVAALEWARDWTPAADASERDVEFRAKLAKVVEVGRVNRKTVGFLACLISSSDRDAQREVDRKAAELETAANRETSTSAHVGSVDERLRHRRVLVEKVFPFESRFGTKQVHKFRDSDGNSLTWWASNATELEVGRWYCVDFAVKAHGEFRGVLETTVTRLKVVNGPEKIYLVAEVSR